MCDGGKPERRNAMLTAALTLFVVRFYCSALFADEVLKGVPAEEILSRRGSLTLRDTTLADALFTISETWQVNLLFSKDISGHVNGIFRDVTLREVLDSLLLANGYGYRPKGQSLIVMSVDALGDANAMLQTASIPFPDGRGEDVVDAARLLLSPQGKIQAMLSVNALMVIDYPENIAKVRTFVSSIYTRPGAVVSDGGAGQPRVLTPVPLETTTSSSKVVYFSPKHTQADSLRETFESFLGAQARVVVIPTENRIAIVAEPDSIQLAHQIFAELDRPREQVRITALIYDVNVAEIERLGVNWTHNARLGNASQAFDGKFGAFPDPTSGAFTLGTATGAAVDAATSSSTLGAARLTTLNRYLDLSTVVSALDKVDGARLLADPSVTVIDREEASIRIVTEIPIQQLTETSQGGAIGTTSFREAGVTLTVTPQIGGDGTITLNVLPTFSVLSGFSEGQPIIDTREASTTVRIADGQTLVIGGLRQRSEVETVSGIPKLMKWKRLGKLFREHDTTIRESELIVFLRPEITYPGTLGTEREEAGLCAAHKALARLNWPSDLPVIPSCNDPYCPYHHPRPRIVRPMERRTDFQRTDVPAPIPEVNMDKEYDFSDGNSKDGEPQIFRMPAPVFDASDEIPEPVEEVDGELRSSHALPSNRMTAGSVFSLTSMSRVFATPGEQSITSDGRGEVAESGRETTARPSWIRPFKRSLFGQQ